jgi:hypothetical protein
MQGALIGHSGLRGLDQHDTLHLLVNSRWLGFDSTSATWEPETNVPDPFIQHAAATRTGAGVLGPPLKINTQHTLPVCVSLFHVNDIGSTGSRGAPGDSLRIPSTVTLTLAMPFYL